LFKVHAKRHGVRVTAALRKLLRTTLAVRDETAEPIVAKTERLAYATGVEGDRLHGEFVTAIGDRAHILTYEPDPDLRDTEQIPLAEPGGVAGFIEREVLPHVPDAWVADGSEKIGYEISFTRYFYKPKHLRTLAEIEADIRALEAETDGLLAEILVRVEA
jgi:type I restriction enzyme M protein